MPQGKKRKNDQSSDGSRGGSKRRDKAHVASVGEESHVTKQKKTPNIMKEFKQENLYPQSNEELFVSPRAAVNSEADSIPAQGQAAKYREEITAELRNCEEQLKQARQQLGRVTPGLQASVEWRIRHLKNTIASKKAALSRQVLQPSSQHEPNLASRGEIQQLGTVSDSTISRIQSHPATSGSSFSTQLTAETLVAESYLDWWPQDLAEAITSVHRAEAEDLQRDCHNPKSIWIVSHEKRTTEIQMQPSYYASSEPHSDIDPSSSSGGGDRQQRSEKSGHGAVTSSDAIKHFDNEILGAFSALGNANRVALNAFRSRYQHFIRRAPFYENKKRRHNVLYANGVTWYLGPEGCVSLAYQDAEDGDIWNADVYRVSVAHHLLGDIH